MRCFIALWPDESARDRLDALGRELHLSIAKARRMRADNLHLTLAFIGELDAVVAPSLARQLDKLCHPASSDFTPFDWSLDRIGVFDAARVLWASGPDEPRLSALSVAARSTLDDMGIKYDRKRFLPHVTLLRDVPRGAAPNLTLALSPPINWRVDRAVLVQSRADAKGMRYLPIFAS